MSDEKDSELVLTIDDDETIRMLVRLADAEGVSLAQALKGALEALAAKHGIAKAVGEKAPS